MNVQEAQLFVEQERGRWWLTPHGIGDAELLRRRERLLNGLTMALALFALASYCLSGFLGWGWYGFVVCVAGAAILARQCSAHANRCRDVREFLGGLPADRASGEPQA
jgi:hypothetical protein